MSIIGGMACGSKKLLRNWGGKGAKETARSVVGRGSLGLRHMWKLGDGLELRGTETPGHHGRGSAFRREAGGGCSRKCLRIEHLFEGRGCDVERQGDGKGKNRNGL